MSNKTLVKILGSINMFYWNYLIFSKKNKLPMKLKPNNPILFQIDLMSHPAHAES